MTMVSLSARVTVSKLCT